MLSAACRILINLQSVGFNSCSSFQLYPVKSTESTVAYIHRYSSLVPFGGRFHARMKICLQKGTNGASELYNCTFLSYPARRCQLFLWNFPKRNGILNACFQNGAFLLQSYTEMIKVPVFLAGHRCVYENKKEN